MKRTGIVAVATFAACADAESDEGKEESRCSKKDDEEIGREEVGQEDCGEARSVAPKPFVPPSSPAAPGPAPMAPPSPAAPPPPEAFPLASHVEPKPATPAPPSATSSTPSTPSHGDGSSGASGS
jgi:hypothetical protein